MGPRKTRRQRRKVHDVWLRRHNPAGPATVVVYGKPDCSLCDKATAILERLRREFDYRVEHIDITADPELFARYRYRIPVVMLNGSEIAVGIVTTPLLRMALRRLPRTSTTPNG